MSELPPIVVFDACVLYPAPLRDLLMWLSVDGLIAARWSELILAEWVESLLKKRPDLKRDRLARTCSMMNRAVPDAMTSGFEPLIEALSLPDVDDRHVLAVAIEANASVILTDNLKDFPPTRLPTGVVAIAPDRFLCELFQQNPEAVLGRLEKHRSILANPAKTVDEYRASLVANGLVEFVELVKNWAQ